jgi:hypothetical protein
MMLVQRASVVIVVVAASSPHRVLEVAALTVVVAA